MGRSMCETVFFCVRHLSSGTGTGLFDCFEKAMEYMKLEAWKTKMIGLGCDGTNANIADGGLKGLLQREVPWVCLRTKIPFCLLMLIHF